MVTKLPKNGYTPPPLTNQDTGCIHYTNSITFVCVVFLKWNCEQPKERRPAQKELTKKEGR